MKPYIFTERNGIHILDLHQTLEATEKAYEFVKQISEEGGKILFVGTKKQAQEAIKEEAQRAGGFYVNHRWLGGLLTNLETIKTALIDTNVDPDLVTYKIPANDDAIRSVKLFSQVIANAAIEANGGIEANADETPLNEEFETTEEVVEEVVEEEVPTEE